MKEDRRDIFISVLVILLIWYFTREDLLLIVAGVYLLLCWFLPFLSNWNHQFWKNITKLIQLVMNPILMGIIFFLVLTPLSWLFRFFENKKDNTETTFEKVKKSNSNTDFEKSW